MTLIELLFVALACALLGLLGRALFGTRGWLLGAVPFGSIMGLLVILEIRGAIRELVAGFRKLVERTRQRRRAARERQSNG